MFQSLNSFFRKSLSRKVLLVLSCSVALIMAVVIYLTDKRQTEEMLREMHINSAEITSALHSGIRYPMALGDSAAVEQNLLDIRHTMRDVDVFICNPEQEITFSSHEGTIHSEMKRYISNQEALRALTVALSTGSQSDLSIEEEVAMKRNVIHIHTVLNEKDCFRCHGSEKKVLGAIVLKKSADRYYAAIGAVRNSNMLVSFFGIGAMVFLMLTMMRRMIIKPVSSLASDLRDLPEKIMKNEPFTVSEITRKDEIGELQGTFNRMAVELADKTHNLEVSRENLEKANKELEAFAYSVSHDLRAPLRNIDGFSKILLDDYADKIDDRAKHYLTRVRDGTSRMSTLIDDMLTFSRIGRSELQVRETDCMQIIRVLLDHHADEIHSRNITVDLKPIPAVKGDPTLLQSLFANLISNAIKFTGQAESPRVTIGFDAGKQAIFVKDNGVGFEMKYHDKIFQVFQRLHLPEEYAGTGIGLAIVKRIADRHDGKVWAESEPGKGAAFFVSFPPEMMSIES